jgi:uncharacterized protein (TIGR02266 family)
MTTEIRKQIRLAIFNGPDQHTLMTNYTVNMSNGGVFIETTNIRRVNTPLVIKFNLPSSEAIITCNARVAWTNESGQLRKSSFPPGMGIQFLDLSLEDLQDIREFLRDGDFKPIW